MKVDVNYSVVHAAIASLEAKKNLTSDEAEVTVQLLKAIQGDYIPTIEELERQEMRVKQLRALDYDDDSTIETYNRLIEQCRLYENKYC